MRVPVTVQMLKQSPEKQFVVCLILFLQMFQASHFCLVDNLMKMAVGNLANNCEAVLAAHGHRSRIAGDLWFNDHELAIPYPNVISLAAGALERDSERTRIEEFLTSRPAGAITGVNDSFSDIDLSAYGFKKLFTSPWSVRKAMPVETIDSNKLVIILLSHQSRIVLYVLLS